MSVVGA